MKRMLICLLIALLIVPGALAAPALEARLTEDGLAVRWKGCACPEATLTIYRDGWPVLVSLVRGTDGGFDVPIWYTREAGDYAAQLRCMDGCARVEAGSVAPPMEEGPIQTEVCPSQPTGDTDIPAPTEKPTEVPTLAPTAIPTPQPTQAPTPQPTQAQGSSISTLAAEVVRQTNMERATRGLTELRVDDELTRAAAVRAHELVESFSHTRPDGSSWSTVSSAVSGENIARGHDSADRVMAAWMSSEGHRDNILRSGYTRVGVCALEAGGVLYWVQLFGV